MDRNRAGIDVAQQQGYKAFIPKPLPPTPPLNLDAETIELLSRADTAIGRLSGISEALPNPDLFVAMYVRKEAVLSSQIEGTEASLEDILEYEVESKPKILANDTAEVVNYVRAMNYGLKRIDKLPLSLRLIREIHAELMKGVRGENKTPGEFRKTQNWIGPKGCTLNTARFVPPPPHEMMQAMGELEKYMHSDLTYPLLIECALIHYQFESIHPFLDGNGRIGRLLITFFLCYKGILKKPLLYLSHYFKQNRLEYYDCLMVIRDNGDFESWIKFFLKGIIYIADEAAQTSHKIINLQNEDKAKIDKIYKKSSKIILLHERLFDRPIVSVKDIVKIMNVTFPTADDICKKLINLNILKEITGKERNRMFAYKNYIDILKQE
ncbi:MAG: Fic family protein [Candidatus Omnitrophota bacterium]|nr:MAG: Fic family protein [Candidatus Omnitrophota bacterium]